MMMNDAYTERERQTAEKPSIKVEDPLDVELAKIDADYAKSPSQKLLDKRLDVLMKMMKS